MPLVSKTPKEYVHIRSYEYFNYCSRSAPWAIGFDGKIIGRYSWSWTQLDCFTWMAIFFFLNEIHEWQIGNKILKILIFQLFISKDTGWILCAHPWILTSNKYCSYDKISLASLHALHTCNEVYFFIYFLV